MILIELYQAREIDSEGYPTPIKRWRGRLINEDGMQIGTPIEFRYKSTMKAYQHLSELTNNLFPICCRIQ